MSFLAIFLLFLLSLLGPITAIAMQHVHVRQRNEEELRELRNFNPMMSRLQYLAKRQLEVAKEIECLHQLKQLCEDTGEIIKSQAQIAERKKVQVEEVKASKRRAKGLMAGAGFLAIGVLVYAYFHNSDDADSQDNLDNQEEKATDTGTEN